MLHRDTSLGTVNRTSFLAVDRNEALQESDEANNVIAVPFTVGP